MNLMDDKFRSGEKHVSIFLAFLSRQFNGVLHVESHAFKLLYEAFDDFRVNHFLLCDNGPMDPRFWQTFQHQGVIQTSSNFILENVDIGLS